MSLFNEIIDEENIEDAYRKSMKAKCKYKVDAILFDKDKTENVQILIDELKSGTYEMQDYNQFYVYEPKERLIYAPKFRDKLVQMMVNNVIKHIYQRAFIYDSYACIDGKGTHRAADRIQHFLRKAGWQYSGNAYVVKIDIKKYFYSIDRKILKSLLPKKIKCKQTLELLYKIIDSSPNKKGLPLGNITSHILANIYLNELDKYCKRKLSIKYYVRYMDDAMLIVDGKEKAKEVLSLIERFLQDNLNLKLNEKKSKTFPAKQGVNMVGYKIYKTHKLLRNDSKKKIKRKVKKMPGLISSGKITKDKAEQMLNSWLGHARNADSYNFVLSLLKRHFYLSLEGKSKINIRIGGVYNAST